MSVTSRQRVAATALAIVAHVAVAVVLMLRSPDPTPRADTTMTVSLVPDFTRPAPALVRAPAVRKPTAPPTPHVAPPAAAPRAQPLPAAPSTISLPPGPYAGSRPEEPGAAGVRRTLRAHLGCNNPGVVLTDTERTACDERLGHDVANARPYPVISPKLKKIFDGTPDCKPDDDWCLYRIGKGAYPGLFSLGKKKKDHSWDQ